MKKRILVCTVVICFVAVMIFSFTGCNMVTVNEERQQQEVVAVVDGNEYTRADFDRLLSQYLYDYYGYNSDQYDALSDDEKASIQSMVLTKLVERELEYQYAIANGYELSEEEEQFVEEQFEAEIEDLKSDYEELLNMNEELTDEERAQKLDEYVNYQLGENFDKEATLQTLIKQQIVGNFEQDIKDSVEVTEDEIKEYYDMNVENQQLMIDQGSFNILTSMSDSIILVYPDDVRRVQAICVGLDSDTSQKITNIRATDSEESSESADSVRDEALADIQDDAEEILDTVKTAKTSEEFAEYIDEYSDETPSEEDKLEGYLLYGDMASLPIPEEAYDEAMTMENVGDISDLIATDYGYYILRLASFPDTVVSYEDAHDKIYDYLLETKQTEALYNKIQELTDNASITKYPERCKEEGQK